MSATKPNSRELLIMLGIGSFNATGIVPYLMIAPAATDPKAGQIVILVQAIQKRLFQLGARDVPDSGQLDVPTAGAITQLLGENWLRIPWATIVQAVNDAVAYGRRLQPSTYSAVSDEQPVAVGGPLDFLPDVPGGLLTYAIGGYFLWRFLKKN